MIIGTIMAVFMLVVARHYNTTLISTIDSFGQEIDTIQRNISKELQNLCKWLDSNLLRLNI